MTDHMAFYEEAKQLGEVVRDGLSYRIYYDRDRQLTIYVLVPGQDQAVGATLQ